MDMLCLAASADPTGYVVVNGRPLDSTDIARLTGGTVQEVDLLLGELERNGVFSRDRSKRIYSRRLVKDAKRLATARQNGREGGNPNLRKQSGNSRWDNQKHNPPLKGRDKTQKPDTRNRIPERSNESSGLGTASDADANMLVERLVEAAGGNVVNGAMGIEVVRPILDLMAMGCDVESDILPAIRDTVPKLPEPLRTWGAGFLRDAVLAKQAARLRGRGTPAPRKSQAEEDDDRWRWRIKFQWIGQRAWVQGGEPGKPDCQVPIRILREFGIEPHPDHIAAEKAAAAASEAA
jgi:hypothetical protein